MESTPLSDKMRAIGTPELVALAKKLDEAVATGSVQQLLGSWARARKAYCLHTGEPLV